MRNEMFARHCVSGLIEAAETAATPGQPASRAVDLRRRSARSPPACRSGSSAARAGRSAGGPPGSRVRLPGARCSVRSSRPAPTSRTSESPTSAATRTARARARRRPAGVPAADAANPSATPRPLPWRAGARPDREARGEREAPGRTPAPQVDADLGGAREDAPGRAPAAPARRRARGRGRAARRGARARPSRREAGGRDRAGARRAPRAARAPARRPPRRASSRLARLVHAISRTSPTAAWRTTSIRRELPTTRSASGCSRTPGPARVRVGIRGAEARDDRVEIRVAASRARRPAQPADHPHERGAALRARRGRSRGRAERRAARPARGTGNRAGRTPMTV